MTFFFWFVKIGGRGKQRHLVKGNRTSIGDLNEGDVFHRQVRCVILSCEDW